MAGFFQPKEKVVNKVLLLPVGEIAPNPAQPRMEFDEAALQGLAESIRENGVLQPVLVRKFDFGGTEAPGLEGRWERDHSRGDYGHQFSAVGGICNP